jgi:hypothetical protein
VKHVKCLAVCLVFWKKCCYTLIPCNFHFCFQLKINYYIFSFFVTSSWISSQDADVRKLYLFYLHLYNLNIILWYSYITVSIHINEQYIYLLHIAIDVVCIDGDIIVAYQQWTTSGYLNITYIIFLLSCLWHYFMRFEPLFLQQTSWHKRTIWRGTYFLCEQPHDPVAYNNTGVSLNNRLVMLPPIRVAVSFDYKRNSHL